MTVRTPDADEKRLATERLAQALRSGLELRWSLPAPPTEASNAFPPRGNVRSFLEPYADPHHLALPRRPHPLSRFVRLARYLIRLLIAPWLYMQSRFNLTTVCVVEQIEQRVRDLEDAELALREAMQTLEKSLLSYADHESDQPLDNLEEAFRRRVNQELGGEGQIGRAGLWFEPPVHVQFDRDGPRIRRVSARILEQIFVHAHLPRPPARLLEFGCGRSTNAIEMASLGFQVLGVDARPMPLRHPNFTMIQTQLAELPFEDESFDAAVALSTGEHTGLGWYTSEASGTSEEQAVAEVFRVLKRGGRLLLTVPFGGQSAAPGQRSYNRVQLDRLLHAFHVVERGYGVQEGDAWTFTFDEPADGGGSLRAVCLLVLEKP
jgi:SAM-dependent methyltransferase